MGLALDGFGRHYGDIPTGGQNRVVVRLAEPADVDAVVHVDSIGFGVEPDVGRPWIEPHLHSAHVEVALAELGGDPVGTAYALRSDGPAGPALYLAGVTVVPAARRRGIAGAISGWLLARAAAAGARIAHLHPDNDEAARVYARLGFVEVNGLDIYVDL
jgi:GNAT superfamily N-acetyltransferase